MTALVFVHGRNQQGQDPEAVRAAWTDGLNRGLGAAQLPSVDAASVAFPFYGDLLHAKTLEAIKAGTDIELHSLMAESTRRIDPAMPLDVAAIETELLQSLCAQARERAGDDPSVVETPEDLRGAVAGFRAANAVLSWLADHTGAAREIIEAFLRDVAVYLRVARAEVLDIVQAAVPAEGELVIVSHSLGTAVARDLLDEPSIARRTVALLTAGSPLGLRAIQRNLLTPGCVHPGVPAWATVWDDDDFVALGHPIAEKFGSPLEEFRVDNPRGRAHSIEEYLAHPQVAAWIGARLSG